MLRTAAPVHATIDRSACPSRGGHGTRHHRAVNGCTCVDARQAQYRYNKRFQAGLLPTRHVPIAGTSRRLRALALLGWSSGMIAARLGCTAQNVAKWRREVHATVHVESAARVAALTVHLLTLPPRTGQAADDARRAARRGQWVPYGAWDDIDDPAETPDLTRLRDNAAVLTVEDIRFLMSQPGGRHTTDEIGRMHGLDGESVQRRLSRRAAAHGRLTDDHVHAIRDEYVRDPDGWDLGAVAARYGVAKSTVSELIHGRKRRDLGLSDLTAHPRGDNTAATPTSRETGKESAA